MRDLLVVFAGELIKREKSLIGIETEVAIIVVCEIPRIASIADYEKLKETQQGLSIAIASVIFVIDDLLHCPSRTDRQGLQFNLNDGHAVNQQDRIIAVMAVVSVDAKLIDDFEVVFALILGVDQSIIERRPVIALEGVERWPDKFEQVS